MKVLSFFVATSWATTVSNVACNGKDLITFTITADQNESFDKFYTQGCPEQDFTMATSSYNQNGNNYVFSFNPYASCISTPDPNRPETYSVDFTLLASTESTLDGKTVIFGADRVNLKCSFLANYQVESDLTAISLAGQEITGNEFRLAFEIKRTDQNYIAEVNTEIETGQPVFHILRSSTPDNLKNSDFSFKPYRIVLEKKDSNMNFPLFNTGMSTCGHIQLGFEMNNDESLDQWNFRYNQILLDSDLEAEYKIVVNLQLCNSLATNIECTAADTLCARQIWHDLPAITTGVHIPASPAGNNLLSLGNNYLANLAIWQNWALSMDVFMPKEFPVGSEGTLFTVASIIQFDNTLTQYPKISILQSSKSEVVIHFVYQCGENDYWRTFIRVDNWVGSTKTFGMTGRIVSGEMAIRIFVDEVEKIPENEGSPIFQSGSVTGCRGAQDGDFAYFYSGMDPAAYLSGSGVSVPVFPVEISNIRYGRLD